MRHAINLLNEFVERAREMPIVADTGDALFASVDIRANQCIAPAYYGTMGFAVPAALGVQIASGRRPLVLVGDGAFQMTGSEISHAVKYGCNPIVVLFNNQRWEMLQAFFPEAPLQRDRQLAVRQTRRSLGRARIPRVHAAAASRRADRGIRREPLHADRGGAEAGRHVAHPARIRRGIQKTCLRLSSHGGRRRMSSRPASCVVSWRHTAFEDTCAAASTRHR